MPDDPKSFRDQLTDQLASDSTDAPALMQLIALVLMNEVLPLLDEIANRVRLQRYRLGLAEMALAELHTIYGHLQDIVPDNSHANSILAKNRAHFREKLENAMKELEQAKGVAE